MKSIDLSSIRSALGCAFLLVVITPFINSSVLAAEFELVTVDEYTESLNAGENPVFDFVAKAVPGGPQIKVLSPGDAAAALVSPVDIEVVFETSADATIDMSSLKIYYLMFVKKDVTGRIMEHATTGSNSIRAEGAKLPKGTHKFLIEIYDSQQRLGSQKIVVKVGA